MKLLTIAIPAYNVENYLPVCINSLLIPELLDDIEILIVNDGSQDGTEAVAEKYRDEYPNSIRIISKNNGGWGSAVNTSIKEANGIYYKNLDSDDWFLKDGLLELIDSIKNSKADIIVSPTVKYYEGNNKYQRHNFPSNCIFCKTLPIEEACKNLNFFFTMHCLCIKTEILKDNNLFIDECFYADNEMCFYPVIYADSIYVQKEPVYCYRIGRAGQSMSIKSMDKNISHIERVAKRICGDFIAFEKDGSLCASKIQYLRRIAVNVASSYIVQVLAISDKSKQKEWIANLSSFRKEYINNSELLKNPDGYSFFASKMLAADFMNYKIIEPFWRFSVNNSYLTDRLWNLLMKE